MAALEPAFGPQVIENKGHIASILTRLQRERSLLTVRVVGSKREFRSAVLSVNGRQRRMTLDELHPERGHELVAGGTELAILSRANGVETRFRVTVTSIGIEDGVYYYNADLPDEVLYHQRRQFVRVPVPFALQGHCQLTDNERTLDFRLTDLSAGGFGAYILRGGEVSRSDALQFRIELEGIEPITGDAEIRHTRQEKERKRLQFGAQFMQMPRWERARVERVVVALQRELLRST